MAGEIFIALFIPSLAGGILAVVLALLRPFTKKFFGYSWHYYIWLAVLAVMLIPLQIPEHGESPAWSDDVQIVSPEPVTAPIRPAERVEYVPDPIVDTQGVVTVEQEPAPVKSVTSSIRRTMNKGKNYFGIIWLIGVLVLFITNILRYIRLLIMLRRHSVVTESLELRELAATAQALPPLTIHREIAVRTADNVSSPFMLGIFNPTLILPERDLSKEQLNNILRHEMTHLRRGDILYKWFALFVKCIHWWNPMVYYITRQLNAECEISCDLSVVEHMSKEEELSYIHTILSLLSAGKPQGATLTTGMTGSKQVLKRRFMMIKNRTKTGKLAKVVSVIAAAAVIMTTVFSSGALAGTLFNEHYSEWADGDIREAKRIGLIGEEQKIKDYTENITRGLFAELVYNAFFAQGVTLVGDNSSSFTDVDDLVLSGITDCLCTMGIMNGKSETEFNPEEYMTREEAATVLYRMVKYSNMDVTNVAYAADDPYYYRDKAEISDWAFTPVFIMREMQLINGDNANYFLPKDNMTVEQAVAMLNRYIERSDEQYGNAEELVYSQMRGIQSDVDNGDTAWRLDPQAVIWEYAKEHDMDGGQISDLTAGVSYCSAVYTVNGTAYQVGLFKPIKQDETGIWVVRFFDGELMKDPQYTVNHFFGAFSQREFDAMEEFCTNECIEGFFGNGYVFGMAWASLNELTIEPTEYLKSSNDFVVQVTVDMIPSATSVYSPDQRETTFYVILMRQADGTYLINEFATGL